SSSPFPNSVWERTSRTSVSSPDPDARQSFEDRRSQTEFGNERGWMRPPRSFPLEPERWPAIVRDARVLLGRPHHLSIHPGGVVITPQPIENHAPLQMAPKGVVITQFDKDSVEYVGLVKIDLLGNRALATVDEANVHLQSLVPKLCLGTQVEKLCFSSASPDGSVGWVESSRPTANLDGSRRLDPPCDQLEAELL